MRPMPVSQVEHVDRVLTPAAVAFVEDLTRRFRPRIEELLERRRDAQRRFDRGERLDFLTATADIRRRDWTVAPLPADLLDRRGGNNRPVDRKKIINTLNSRAPVFMAGLQKTH